MQASLFSRYSSLYFSPDPVGDLLFTGIAQTGRALGLVERYTKPMQAGASTTPIPCAPGFQITAERTVANTQSNVFDLNSGGMQTTEAPVSLAQGLGKTGGIYGLYLQDEWTLAHGADSELRRPLRPRR